MIETTRKSFIGLINQTPPIFSAIKVNGKRAYTAARAGEEIELKSREIEILEFDVNTKNFPEIGFRVVCSKGTYIRSLARDFGLALNSGAYLSSLRRTKIGDFSVENAYSVDNFVKILKAENENL